jgi:2-polyprenyl-3-methyl-5-hydroxy-6-metoxy-1,4-benzoquinol methylase
MSDSWALALYRRSVIKQEKIRRIAGMLDDSEGKTCLDIGGDNGIASWLLRRRGGVWHSADLDATTVDSIRRLVGTNVHQIDGTRLPFETSSLDMVVIVDFLEHIESDRLFAGDLARVLRPGGLLVVNVPHLKPGSRLNRLRDSLGLTDEKHGHVRPGYDLAGLTDTLGGEFVLERSRTYSKAFSELVDIALNAAYERKKSRGPEASARSPKGTVVTEADVARHKTALRLLTFAYPVLWIVVRLDGLLFAQEGYKLIARYRRRSADAPSIR